MQRKLLDVHSMDILTAGEQKVKGVNLSIILTLNNLRTTYKRNKKSCSASKSHHFKHLFHEETSAFIS